MEEKEGDVVYKCPHCNKCIAIFDEHDKGVYVTFHKERPPARPDAARLLAQRRCAKCKQDFVVETYVLISEILRWMITDDTHHNAYETFTQNMDLIEALRKDEKFMALLLGNGKKI